MAQEIKEIPLDKLRLWTENPRDPVDGSMSDYDVINHALTDPDKKWNLQKLVERMGPHYDFSEIPTVVDNGGNYIVYDGNRRIAILKYLQDKVLQDSLENQLVIKENQKALAEITALPCNVCDIETALTNIKRKHWNSGDWGRLERDYFLVNFMGEPKSDYIDLDEQTNLITAYPFLNQRFVKEEVFVPKTLNKIGLSINSGGITSMYDKRTTTEIINEIVGLIKNKEISTRQNRKDLLKPLTEKRSDLKKILREYDSNKSKRIYFYVEKKPTTKINAKPKRKTQINKETDILFGKSLFLKKGRINNLYIGIERIFHQNEKNLETVLPIIAIALRLLIETGAREYYNQLESELGNHDQIYKRFLKEAHQEMQMEKSTQNFLFLTDTWLNSNYNLEAILGKFAHGNMIVTKSDVIKTSVIIGDIINYYFKRP